MKLNMCLQAALAAMFAISAMSCEKEVTTYAKSTSPLTDSTTLTTDSNVKKAATASAFTTYTIREGEHYCDNNSYPFFTTPALYFTVKFDSSAIYENVDSKNQHDENKLYGFSDNNSHHQQFSARFGWRWCNDQLELSAYTYNKGVRSDKVLGAVPIGAENKCAIIVNGDHYDFVLNGVVTSVPRESKTAKAMGYKLLPYFGGDEVAPHTVTIQIREDKGL